VKLKQTGGKHNFSLEETAMMTIDYFEGHFMSCFID